MSPASPGYLYSSLAAAAQRRGHVRSLYGSGTTLSRRGLLIRADRRADELRRLGIRHADALAIALGNTTDLVVMLLACSKLGALAVPLDPAQGERLIRQTAARLPLRAVIRRSRGDETAAPDYGPHYRFEARRRLSGARLAIDILESAPPSPTAAPVPDGAELVLSSWGIGGVGRDGFRTSRQLAALGAAAAATLELGDGVLVLCTQPLVIPRFFVSALLGWLSSGASLCLAEGPLIGPLRARSSSRGPLVALGDARNLIALSRAFESQAPASPPIPFVVEAILAPVVRHPLRVGFCPPPRQLLWLEELGILGHQRLEPGAAFVPAPRVSVRAGAPMHTGGRELLVRTDHSAIHHPPIPLTEPGSPAEGPWHHTGYAGRFDRNGDLWEILGRDDGLVDLDGRRGCLEHVEQALLDHRRLTWINAQLHAEPDGDAWISVDYRATGQSPVDDLEEYAVERLPSFLVPRRFERRDLAE